MKIAYLACPYSHEDPKVKQWGHNRVNQVAHDLMRQGIYVYSPLTHNVPLAHLGIHGNWLTWSTFDHEMLSRCDCLIVLKLEGWQHSMGVQAEIKRAEALGKTIEWLEDSQKEIELFTGP
jgi:hypothetical protein